MLQNFLEVSSAEKARYARDTKLLVLQKLKQLRALEEEDLLKKGLGSDREHIHLLCMFPNLSADMEDKQKLLHHVGMWKKIFWWRTRKIWSEISGCHPVYCTDLVGPFCTGKSKVLTQCPTWCSCQKKQLCKVSLKYMNCKSMQMADIHHWCTKWSFPHVFIV